MGYWSACPTRLHFSYLLMSKALNEEKHRVNTQSFEHRHSLFNNRVTQEITVKLNLNLSATSANHVFPPLLSNAYSAVDMIFNLTPRIDNLVDKIITRVFSCRFGCC